MLLSLVYEERREEVIDKFIEFICQLSVKDAEIAVGTLKEPICFVKGGREKQNTFSYGYKARQQLLNKHISACRQWMHWILY